MEVLLGHAALLLLLAPALANRTEGAAQSEGLWEHSVDKSLASDGIEARTSMLAIVVSVAFATATIGLLVLYTISLRRSGWTPIA